MEEVFLSSQILELYYLTHLLRNQSVKFTSCGSLEENKSKKGRIWGEALEKTGLRRNQNRDGTKPAAGISAKQDAAELRKRPRSAPAGHGA